MCSSLGMFIIFFIEEYLMLKSTLRNFIGGLAFILATGCSVFDKERALESEVILPSVEEIREAYETYENVSSKALGIIDENEIVGVDIPFEERFFEFKPSDEEINRIKKISEK